MSVHGREHEALLEALLSAGGDPSEALGESSLAGCKACQRSLEDLGHVSGRLDALGRSERQALADKTPFEPGRAEEVLRARMLEDAQRASGTQATSEPRGSFVPPAGTAPTPVRPRYVWLALAAALLVFGWLGWRAAERGTPRPEAGTLLGTRTLLSHPQGTVESYTPFRWQAQLPENGWFRVIVYGEAESAPVARSPRLTAPRWSPDPDALESPWPAQIRWKLEVYRGTGAGDLVGVTFASARLSSR